VRLVVDVETGAIEQRLDYDEFGAVLADTSPGFQVFGFAGGLYDGDTGFVRFGARELDPRVGKWASKDPLAFRPGPSNLYLYVRNDPINGRDSSGLQSALDDLYNEIFGNAECERCVRGHGGATIFFLGACIATIADPVPLDEAIFCSLAVLTYAAIAHEHCERVCNRDPLLGSPDGSDLVCR
jgi:RHS repeat-associated protein